GPLPIAIVDQSRVTPSYGNRCSRKGRWVRLATLATRSDSTSIRRPVVIRGLDETSLVHCNGPAPIWRIENFKGEKAKGGRCACGSSHFNQGLPVIAPGTGGCSELYRRLLDDGTPTAQAAMK